jgi:hypothetical protein
MSLSFRPCTNSDWAPSREKDGLLLSDLCRSLRPLRLKAFDSFSLYDSIRCVKKPLTAENAENIKDENAEKSTDIAENGK